jgi:hypothetical protein
MISMLLRAQSLFLPPGGGGLSSGCFGVDKGEASLSLVLLVSFCLACKGADSDTYRPSEGQPGAAVHIADGNTWETST